MSEPTNNDLLPVRMLNEYVYCPRLFHLMHVEARWADNRYTAEGTAVHRRVDQLDHVLPGPVPEEPAAMSARDDGDEPPVIGRSVPLGSERLGITAKLDLVSTAGDEALPVETKRGKVPNNPDRSWEPERVQLMAQGLLLREHGYTCDHGVLYFAGSRTRVDIPFSPELAARTLALLERARAAAERTELPPPLENSPKCVGCSLAGICLPDETLSLQEVPADPAAPTVRRLYPIRDDALPFYVQTQGATVGKKSSTLVVRKQGEELGSARLIDVSQLVLCGNVMVTQQAIHLLCEAGVPIVHLSSGHWFYGITAGITIRNGLARAAQYRAADSPEKCLALARAVVRAKGANQRTMLRRNADPRPATAMDQIAYALNRLQYAADLGAVLGHEGGMAAAYFGAFGAMLKSDTIGSEWAFANRNRRPPRDPINAMLSFAYALLAKECATALLAEGLDPWWGLYHQARHGRPSLALDLMEEFRPLIADSAVLTAINTGMLRLHNFTVAPSGCIMKAPARKALIQAYEARLDQVVTHPTFKYKTAWRSIIRMQARFLGRWLRGDVPTYDGLVTR